MILGLAVRDTRTRLWSITNMDLVWVQVFAPKLFLLIQEADEDGKTTSKKSIYWNHSWSRKNQISFGKVT